MFFLVAFALTSASSIHQAHADLGASMFDQDITASTKAYAGKISMKPTFEYSSSEEDEMVGATCFPKESFAGKAVAAISEIVSSVFSFVKSFFAAW